MTVGKSVVQFGELPPDGRSHSDKWKQAAAELKANPGKWALVENSVSPTKAQSIRRGQIAVFRPAGAFEATSRVRPDRTFDIWARYVGEGES